MVPVIIIRWSTIDPCALTRQIVLTNLDDTIETENTDNHFFTACFAVVLTIMFSMRANYCHRARLCLASFLPLKLNPKKKPHILHPEVGVNHVCLDDQLVRSVPSPPLTVFFW